MHKDIIIPIEEQTDKKGNEPVVVNNNIKTNEEEVNNKVKGFNEGLANNSDTEKK